MSEAKKTKQKIFYVPHKKESNTGLEQHEGE